MIADLFLFGFCVFFLYYSLNCIYYYFPSCEKKTTSKRNPPFLSVLIPARNEEKNIKNVVDSVLENENNYLECIILDDNSSDKTKEILEKYSDKRLTVISGKPLPKGWIGKNWACHQLSQNAKGDIILFSDADTIHSKKGLSLLIEKMTSTNADLLSGIPKQIVESVGEAITIPFIGLFSFGALPHFLFRIKGISWAAASNGQYQCFKRTSYDEIGGYKEIYKILADDIIFPKLFKKADKKVVYTDVSKLVSSRMYDGFRDAFNGFSKSFYPTINESPFLAILVGVLILLVFLSPYLLLFFSPSLKALLCLIISFALWVFACINIHINPIFAISHPIVPFILISILISSVHSRKNKGYRWKGRIYQ